MVKLSCHVNLWLCNHLPVWDGFIIDTDINLYWRNNKKILSWLDDFYNENIVNW